MRPREIKKELVAIDRWDQFTGHTAILFAVLLAFSVATAVLEYHTMEPFWLGVATLLFNIVTPMPVVLAIAFRLGLFKKERAKQLLRQTSDSLETTVNRK